MIAGLEKMRDDWLKDVERTAKNLPHCEDINAILREIQSLKQSERRDILGITGDLSSIAGLLIGLIGIKQLFGLICNLKYIYNITNIEI
jgi:hypothetical protein